jgi:hypothetical protein
MNYNAYNEKKGLIMNKAWNKIRQAWEDNPIMVIVVASFAATAASKLIDSSVNARNSNAWKKEVDRRDRMTR